MNKEHLDKERNRNRDLTEDKKKKIIKYLNKEQKNKKKHGK